MRRNNVLLSKANSLIRKNRPPELQEWEYDIREQIIRFPENPMSPIKMTFICFRSAGCSFDTRGECTMCNYNVHRFQEPPSSRRLEDSVKQALTKNPHYEYLFMNPLGSMFDSAEVPSEALRNIFELVAATDCSSFGFETRPEFLTQQRVAQFASVLRQKKKIICIGLETSDPWILRNCVGKLMRPVDFQMGADFLRRYEINTIANILLGAPFLTERETIIDAVRSIRWALENGAYMCVLFPTYVKRWTLAHWLWERDLYHSPSLWSLIEVLYAVGPELSSKVGLAWLSIDPTQSDLITDIPQTCPRCRGSVLDALRKFNARADFSLIESLRRATCDCRASWKQKILAPVSPLHDRVLELYGRVAHELVGGTWWEQNKNIVSDQLGQEYDANLPSQGLMGGLL